MDVYATLTIPKDVHPGEDIYPDDTIIKKGKYRVIQWDYTKKPGLSDVIEIINLDTKERNYFMLRNADKYVKDWVVTTTYE